MNPAITIRTLTDGGQTAPEVARADRRRSSTAPSGRSISRSTTSTSAPETAAIVGDAIRRAHASRRPRSGSPTTSTTASRSRCRRPPRPTRTLIARCRSRRTPIAGVPDLMHHKYVVRDGESVWTGSTNWTDDSWSRQENVIAIVDSPPVAADFRRDFEQLLSDGRRVAEAGDVAPRWHDGLRPWFTPGHGEDLSHRIAQAIGHARRRDPDLLAGAHRRAGARRPRAGGRGTAGSTSQGASTRHRCAVSPTSGARRASRGSCRCSRASPPGAFAAKPSTPYGTGTLHDFMHAKLTVADDTVFVGSFNLSRSGERNAENVLEIDDAAIRRRARRLRRPGARALPAAAGLTVRRSQAAASGCSKVRT